VATIDEAAIVRFVYDEVAILNDERYGEWLGLISEDFDYRMPAPVLRDDPRLPRYHERSLLSWESTASLRLRFQRVDTDWAWADRPPAFHRRHVTAVRVRPATTGSTDEWEVESDVLVFRSRAPEDPTITSAKRVDTLRDVGGRLCLARRTVYIDLDRPKLSQISVLF